MLIDHRLLVRALILLLATGCGSSANPSPDALPDTLPGIDASDGGASDTNPGVDLSPPDLGAADLREAAAVADLGAPDAVEVGAGHPACAACAADELCVVAFDGTCRVFGVRCAKKTARCQAAACTEGCNDDLCGQPDGGPRLLTCMAAPCPTSGQYPNAILCYGP